MPSTPNPRVSVIIPAYNGEAYIQQAVESVLKQTYPHWELIVVDDGSTDGTQQIIQQYGDRLHYLYRDNQGVAAARNRGLQAAKGEFIAFLDQDDFFLPDKLAAQVACFQKHPSLGIVHSGWRTVNQQGEAISDIQSWLGIPELDLAAWVLWKPVFLGAMLFRRDWLEFAGGFNSRYHQAPDVDLLLRLALMGCEAAWARQTTVCYRQHDRNASHNTPLQAEESLAVLDRFFARSNLPEEIRQLESRSRYQNLVWSAWRLYHTGKLGSMADYLERSRSHSPYSRTETILDWVRSFQRYAGEYGRELDAYSLSNSAEWQALTACLV